MYMQMQNRRENQVQCSCDDSLQRHGSAVLNFNFGACVRLVLFILFLFLLLLFVLVVIFHLVLGALRSYHRPDME